MNLETKGRKIGLYNHIIISIVMKRNRYIVYIIDETNSNRFFCYNNSTFQLMLEIRICIILHITSIYEPPRLYQISIHILLVNSEN